MSILDASRRVRATLSLTVRVAAAGRRSRSDRSAQMRRPIVDINIEMD